MLMSRKFDLVLIGTQETFSLKNLQLLSCFLLIYFCLIRFPCAHPNVILTSIFGSRLPSKSNTWHESVGPTGKCVGMAAQHCIVIKSLESVESPSPNCLLT